MLQIASCPLGVHGNPITKSTVILSHFNSGLSIRWSNPVCLWCSAFPCWQIRQRETNLVMSLSIPSYQYSSFRSWCILVAPGCIEYLELWASSKIILLKSSILGTQSRSPNRSTLSLSIMNLAPFPFLTSSIILVSLGYSFWASWICVLN